MRRFGDGVRHCGSICGRLGGNLSLMYWGLVYEEQVFLRGKR